MKKGVISWFAQNGVAANLVMIVIIVGGLMTISGIKKEIFPEYAVDMVRVSVSYRGAAPEEVEEGVCVRIEEAIQDLDGIERISSLAAEGGGTVSIEILPGYDLRKALDDIKARVDAIDTFPEETEKPTVQEITNRFQVINVSISGDTDEITLKRLAERVREDLISLPEITQAEVVNAPPYEISIEVSEEDMRRHGLTFDAVANAVRRSSFDLPGGSVKTRSGEILLRTKGQAYRGPEFENLTLMTKPDGTKLVLGDVANVIDGFAETDQWTRFDGEPTVMVRVYRVGEQNALEVADAVHGYVEDAARRLPEGISVTTWQDNAQYLRGRMDLLLRNGRSGLILVFVVLALFLRLRLAVWVTIGIPISFLGAIAMMPIFDVSVNMISLFSFILVLGIVVDDAIVVGESIFARQQAGVHGVRGAVEGTHRVAMPVIFGVLTTMCAFAPMLFVPGWNGKIWRVIPLIIIPTLFFSLIESKLVLPYHLSHSKPKPKRVKRNILIRIWDGFFDFFGNGLIWFIKRVYSPVLRVALEWRYLTVAVAIATLLLTVGLVGGGYIGFAFLPEVEADYVSASLTMPQETPLDVTGEAVQIIEDAALKLQEEVKQQGGADTIRHVLTSVGDQPFQTMARQQTGNFEPGMAGAHLGEIAIELAPSQLRTMSSLEVANRWRELAGPIAGAVELKFTSNLIGGGGALSVQIAGEDMDALREIASQTKAKLAEYPGVFDITDTFRGGKPEVKLSITSNAESLGLSLRDLARQVRQGFYGEEAQRIQRGRDDIRVMVRYPEQDRRSLGDLEGMRVRAPDGSEVPFSTVARAEMGRGFATIRRVDRRRAINVTADVDDAVASSTDISADLTENFLDPLIAKYPGVYYTVEGEQRDQMEAIDALAEGFVIALLVIYALMAIPFKSYIQPLIVMTAVPFGIVGAVWGHVIMGLSMSILSLCGLIALTGIVVNDSLVLVTYINTLRASGKKLADAVREAGAARFRAIILTSLTTAAGITPLMLEKEVQAQFLIPMAVALAYGVIFSTMITLVLVPSSYLILEDLRLAFRWLMGMDSPATEPLPEQGPAGVPVSPAPDAALFSNGAGSALMSRQPSGQSAAVESTESRTQLGGEVKSAGESSDPD